MAAGVFTGSLLVGSSVRGSLQELFLARLGKTENLVLSSYFFRESLSADVASSATPLIAIQGMVTNELTRLRRNDVRLYGVDDRFWSFHGIELSEMPKSDRILVTSGLAKELQIEIGDNVLLRAERPSDVARGSLHGIKADTGRTLRLEVMSMAPMDFSLYPHQDVERAVFVSLEYLQNALAEIGKVNTILVAGGIETDEVVSRLREAVDIEDMGVRVRSLSESNGLVIESASLMLRKYLVSAIKKSAVELGSQPNEVFTYLANSLRVRGKDIPYSLVSALDESMYKTILHDSEWRSPSIVLNEWAAADLNAKPGDRVDMDFFVWKSGGKLELASESFVVNNVITMEGLGADRDLAPLFPGITDTENLSDWDPPFPIELARIRKQDEEYWDVYRTAPKAFIRMRVGQEIWPVRQGVLTAVRVGGNVSLSELRDSLRHELDPILMGFSVRPVRSEGVAASRGATDFGEYFIYFSYFLMVAALLLTGLFFKLGIEQRLRELGTLRCVGYSMRTVLRLFMLEGLILSVLGGLLGVVVAISYAWIVMYGLRTWWVDAVGTRLLTLHVEWFSVTLGTMCGVAVASFAIMLTLRHLGRSTVRKLISRVGGWADEKPTSRGTRNVLFVALSAFFVAGCLVIAASLKLIPELGAFFGAGNLLLAAFLMLEWVWLVGSSKGVVPSSPFLATVRLGCRNASYRPGRSLIAVALIAFASFTIVAVDAFRKDMNGELEGRSTGTGGFALLGESLLPFYWDPNSEEGQDALNLPFDSESDAVPMHFRTFRLRPGDDASCLNLYRPQNPRILGASSEFISESRFVFSDSMAQTSEEVNNPWLLLNRQFSDGAVPIIGDSNSMAYVLHVKLGDDFLLPREGETPLRLRLVATLADSIFQGELVMAEEHFLENFSGVDGFRYFLVDTPASKVALELIEQRMEDFGVDVQLTNKKLASFHRVENTYLSTFQTLGGLGLILGTLGLACILLRNILERSSEIAFLCAVGFDRRDITRMILSENVLLLLLGVFTGTLAAIVAISPALLERNDSHFIGTLSLLLISVAASGCFSSLIAVRQALRMPLLPSLRAE